MATLVLSAAGQYFGGPIGAMIGSQIGQVIDREVLFRPKGREGPRLTELAVQTSSYGTQIPKVFGRMRVAGSVIWSTDLIEHRSKEGGKGRPTVTNYSYTASFAVALSARAILGVGRIWAEGKLLRGAAGDFKVKTGFRLHPGDEDQAADPLIAAAEGGGMTPAHRGIAYAMFEDLELAEFGNRIPSLTFEVIADAGPVDAGAVIEAVTGGEIVSPETSQALAGFSAYGASVRAVAETLAGVSGGWFRSGDGPIALASGSGDAPEIDAPEIEDSSARARGRASAKGSRSIAAADSVARTLSLSHYDPARDWQIGVQRAIRPGAGSREARIELPAAIDAGAAKTVAEAALARMDVERERRSVSLGWDAIGVTPGARVTIAGAPGVWRVDGWSLEHMVVTLDCVGVAPGTLPAGASGGRVLPAPDLEAGETIVHAFELPPIDGGPASAPRLAIAAAGTRIGWRRAALLLSIDDGARWTAPGGTAQPAVLGEIVVPPGAGPATLMDRVNMIEVELAHDGMELNDADAAAMDAGANLAMAGSELIQFARAEPLGANRWRLSGLWRGRRGTEAAAGLQAAGDRFVLLTAATLAMADLPAEAMGATARILAEGPGDDEAAEAQAAISGVSIVPPCPVHLSVHPAADGASEVRWARRSRAGWRWSDGIDAPLGEESEGYRVTIAPEGGLPRIATVSAAAVLVSEAERTAAVLVTVRQIGSHGLSAPAAMLLPALV